MISIRQLLCNHDWTWAYADDQFYWKKGPLDEKEIKERLLTLECPFSWEELRRFIHKHYLGGTDGLILQHNGYIRPELARYNMGGIHESDTITWELYQIIAAWLLIQPLVPKLTPRNRHNV